jgi:3-deoxy-D-manno-octulosonic-acid transferase
MLFFYNLFLLIYDFGIKISALGNEKAQQWVSGRRNIHQRIKDACGLSLSPIVWMHCASLGEFEQGRGLLERIKICYPNYRILLTFFSPSGYEIRKNYTGADMIFYLPLDGKKSSRKFLNNVNPTLALFIKYDSWFYYLHELRERKIPTLLISAMFTPNLAFFGKGGSFFRNMLDYYSHIFLQDLKSKKLLEEFNIKAPLSVNGDTRFDRVIDIASSPFTHPLFEKFCSSGDVLIAGSTWKDDEKFLIELLKECPEIKLVIAPHEINKQHIDELKAQFSNSFLLSDSMNTEIHRHSNVLIVDTIGMLSKIYRYATFCYVGGGFNKSGIHNILEPAVYGKTICFGKYYGFSREAESLIKLGAAFSFNTKDALIAYVKDLLGNKSSICIKNVVAKDFVEANKGATNKIINYLVENRLLSNSIN